MTFYQLQKIGDIGPTSDKRSDRERTLVEHRARTGSEGSNSHSGIRREQLHHDATETVGCLQPLQKCAAIHGIMVLIGPEKTAWFPESSDVSNDLQHRWLS